MVDKRESFAAYKRLRTIDELARRIANAAGLSTNIELVPQAVKLGGNGPNMANALVRLGAGVSYLGALGVPTIDPVFLELTERCREVHSVAAPGHTDALEFNDGKVMLGKMESLNEVTWRALKEKVGEDCLKRIFTDVDLVATVNWTMLPDMNEIWRGLLNLKPEPKEGFKPYFFVDLADPGKRSSRDILEALRLIQKFTPFYRVILGLNRKEASELAAVLGLRLSGPNQEVDLEEITTELGAALKLWCVVVHPPNEVGAAGFAGYVAVPGPFTANPRLTTGAGDNFNAGFCLGLMLQLSLKNSLLLGKAVSGFYVRSAYSPSFEELKDFLKLWAAHAGEAF
ncbi:MAG TPA: carbohydrate kinase family protein [Firmicutes bacterium]|nr:carbohydrate kinase family protein [Bacillota bacterium]